MLTPHCLHDARNGWTGAIYIMVNSKVIADKQPCPFFDPNSKERFTWGILRIYDNVRLADLSDIQQNLIYTVGHTVYYLIKRKERVLTESKQKEIRDIFTDKGYDGSVIKFDRYEEQHPTLLCVPTSVYKIKHLLGTKQ